MTPEAQEAAIDAAARSGGQPVAPKLRAACAGALVLGALVVGLGWGTPANARIELRSNHLGNVFAPDEPARFAVTSDSPKVFWSVTDFFHSRVASGTLDLTKGSAELTLKSTGVGWFELDARPADAPAGAQGARADFAVLRPPLRPASLRYDVQTHFAQGWDLDVLPLVARAGLGQVRDELYWQVVETTPGQYDIPPQLQRYLDALARADLKLNLVLSFGNPLYDGGNTPYDATGDQAFASYARFLARELRGRLSALEVWNEFNGSFCKGPCDKDRPAAYTRLLDATYAPLKAAAPDVPVAGGAAVLAPIPWVDALAEHGALQQMDALVIHPYKDNPEGTEYWLRDLRALLARRGRTVPIWATEFSLQAQGPEGARDTARYLVKDAAILLSEGVSRISWYLLRDYATFGGMGLVAGPDSPLGRYAAAPAYQAYAVFIREVGARPARGSETHDSRTRVYRFGDGADAVLVAWSPMGPTRLEFEATKPVRLVDMMGRGRDISPKGGWAEVELDGNPIYLGGRIGAVRVPDRPALVASSAGDFAGPPGALNATPARRGSGEPAGQWSYGAWVCPEPAATIGRCPADYQKTDATLAPLDWQADPWRWAWRSNRFSSLEVTREGAHPGTTDGHAVWAVRRWTAAKTEQLRVSGRVYRASGAQGDGTGALVLVDGRPLWAATVGGPGRPADAAFSVTVAAHPGTRLDVAVTPGPGADIAYDFTDVSTLIEKLSNKEEP